MLKWNVVGNKNFLEFGWLYNCLLAKYISKFVLVQTCVTEMQNDNFFEMQNSEIQFVIWFQTIFWFQINICSTQFRINFENASFQYAEFWNHDSFYFWMPQQKYNIWITSARLITFSRHRPLTTVNFGHK